MEIQYIEPLSRAIARTKRELFNPLDLKKWFVIGFTAFLARLADVEFPSPPAPNASLRRSSRINVEDILYFPQRVWEWLGNHPGWAILIAFALFFLCILIIVLTWVSARGKFMFLDNVVSGRARIVAPWYEYRHEGNSFFLCNLLWLIVFSAVAIAYIFYCFASLQSLYQSSGSSRALILPAILAALGFMIISIVGGFIFVLLRDFVVQIMYRDRITAASAIQKFLPLFMSQFFHFIGYGIFLLCLLVVIVIGIVIFGFITCCVGFLVLAIPYINVVVLLPVMYAVRTFSVEFLEQFGPEYHVFPRPEANPPGPEP